MMNNPLPTFSIIIPTYNRAKMLEECLLALTELNYPQAQFEVIVVDDGGDQQINDITVNVNNALNIKLIRQQNAGPGAARNAGAAIAKGEFLAFTDDDCKPAPDWLSVFANAHIAQPGLLLGGQTENGLLNNPYSTASQMLQSWFYHYCQTRRSPMQFFASNNLSIAKANFMQLGGFDTETLRFASEDRELSGRWLGLGGELRYLPDAKVYHYHHLTAGSFVAQHFAYGRGAYRLRLAREKYQLPPLPGDRVWMLKSLTHYPFINADFSRGMVMAVLAFCTHAANVVGYFYERRQEKLK